MHNYCRRAKHFKLDEDYEVMDEFSGNARRHGQPRWRDNGMHNKLGDKHKRWFRSQVGKRWDTVFSDFCEAAKQAGSYGEHWLHDRVEWVVNTQVSIIDGYPHERPMCRKASEEFRPLWKGDLYVHPVTKVLCVAKGLKKAPKPSRFPPPDTVVEVGDVLFEQPGNYRWSKPEKHKVAFKHQTITDRKIGAGLTTHAKHKVWFKYVPYLYSWVDRYGKYVGRDESGLSIYEAVTRYEVRYIVTTASKREIKHYKLNEQAS